MKQINVLAVALSLALAPATAVAQNTATGGAGAKSWTKLDTNRDGVIDRAEASSKPRLAQRFDQMDNNKDGRLSADERPQRGKGMGHRRGGHGGWMQRADANKDGRISRAEAQVMQGKAGEHFDRMDVNKDGYVDRTDMHAHIAQKRAAFFAGADDNKDGRLSRDEFVVEQGARNGERRERWASRVAANGKQIPARPAPSVEQQIERATAIFARMDTDRNGVLTRAEFDAAKAGWHGKGKHGH